MNQATEDASYKLTLWEHACSLPGYLLGLAIMMVTEWGWWDLPFIFVWAGLIGWIAIHTLRSTPRRWWAAPIVFLWPFIAVGVLYALYPVLHE